MEANSPMHVRNGEVKRQGWMLGLTNGGASTAKFGDGHGWQWWGLWREG